MGVLPLLHILHVQHKADYLEEFLKRGERQTHSDMMVERQRGHKRPHAAPAAHHWHINADPEERLAAAAAAAVPARRRELGCRLLF